MPRTPVLDTVGLSIRQILEFCCDQDNIERNQFKFFLFSYVLLSMLFSTLLYTVADYRQFTVRLQFKKTQESNTLKNYFVINSTGKSSVHL